MATLATQNVLLVQNSQLPIFRCILIQDWEWKMEQFWCSPWYHSWPNLLLVKLPGGILRPILSLALEHPNNYHYMIGYVVFRTLAQIVIAQTYLLGGKTWLSLGSHKQGKRTCRNPVLKKLAIVLAKYEKFNNMMEGGSCPTFWILIVLQMSWEINIRSIRRYHSLIYTLDLVSFLAN